MGERGPTATHLIRVGKPTHFSRWENGGQPQLAVARRALPVILADGRTGANRNNTGSGAAGGAF